MFDVLQITMIVWQKLSSAREVLVEQELKDVLLSGRWMPSQKDSVTAGNSSTMPLLAPLDGSIRLPATVMQLPVEWASAGNLAGRVYKTCV